MNTKYLGSVPPPPSLIINLKRHIHLEICQTNYISDLAICFYYQIITVILIKTNVRQKRCKNVIKHCPFGYDYRLKS